MLGFPVVISLLTVVRDGVTTRSIVAVEELAHYLMIISVLQLLVGVVANSLFLRIVIEFKQSGELYVPEVRKIAIGAVVFSVAAGLFVCAALGATFIRYSNALKLPMFALTSLSGCILLINSFLTTTLAATASRRYLLVPVGSIIVGISLIAFFKPSLLGLLSIFSFGSALDLICFSILFWMANVRVTNTPPKLEAAVIGTALLNSAYPMLTQVLMRQAGSSVYLAVSYGQKIAQALSSLAAGVMSAIFFQITWSRRLITMAFRWGIAFLLLTISMSWLLFPMPLAQWLGTRLVSKINVGGFLLLAFCLSWILMFSNITYSFVYRILLGTDAKRLLAAKAGAFAISAIALSASTSYPILFICFISLIPLIEVGPLLWHVIWKRLS